jgi:hypothetical protein
MKIDRYGCVIMLRFSLFAAHKNGVAYRFLVGGWGVARQLRAAKLVAKLII